MSLIKNRLPEVRNFGKLVAGDKVYLWFVNEDHDSVGYIKEIREVNVGKTRDIFQLDIICSIESPTEFSGYRKGFRINPKRESGLYGKIHPVYIAPHDITDIEKKNIIAYIKFNKEKHGTC